MFLLVTFGQKKWLFEEQQWLSDESVSVIDKLCCNKSEVSWQKLPHFKICWPTWGFLSWSQTTKNAEKLRVASLSGWHHSGAVCSKLVINKSIKRLGLSRYHSYICPSLFVWIKNIIFEEIVKPKLWIGKILHKPCVYVSNKSYRPGAILTSGLSYCTKSTLCIVMTMGKSAKKLIWS